MNTQTCVTRLFFATMNDACKKEIFSVTINSEGRYECARELTSTQQDAVGNCFKFFNEFNCDFTYALDLDGGVSDGISRCGIHHDVAAE